MLSMKHFSKLISSVLILFLVFQNGIIASQPDFNTIKHTSVFKEKRNLVEIIELLKVSDCVSEIFPGATTLPVFSTLALDTRIEGDDANRAAALDFRGPFIGVTNGKDADQANLNYEYVNMSIVIPKENIPEIVKKGKDLKAVIQNYMAMNFKKHLPYLQNYQ